MGLKLFHPKSQHHAKNILYLMFFVVIAKIILAFAFGGLTILNGINGAVVVACHANGAMAMPHWTAFFEGDVHQGTYLNALAAVDASLGGVVFPIVGSKAAEARIDQMALQPSRTTDSHGRKMFLIGDTRNAAFEGFVGCLDFALRVFVGIEFETGHTDVGLRHLHTETGRQ